MDQLTTATAGAAIVSPWWLPVLQGVSTGASWALPVLGCAWLIMQMYHKYLDRKEKRNASRPD